MGGYNNNNGRLTPTLAQIYPGLGFNVGCSSYQDTSSTLKGKRRKNKKNLGLRTQGQGYGFPEDSNVARSALNSVREEELTGTTNSATGRKKSIQRNYTCRKVKHVHKIFTEMERTRMAPSILKSIYVRRGLQGGSNSVNLS